MVLLACAVVLLALSGALCAPVVIPLSVRHGEFTIVESGHTARDGASDRIETARVVPVGNHKKAARAYLDSVTEVDMNGNYNQYVFDIYVGTPQQKFIIHADTGSGLTAIPVQGCQSCDQNTPNPYFDYLGSTSYSPVQCTSFNCTARQCDTTGQEDTCAFNYKYGSNQIHGRLGRDEVAIGPYTVTGIVGLIEGRESNFEAPFADGIIGLSYNGNIACSPSCVTPPLDMIIAKYNLKDQFAMLLRNTDGVFNIGGMDPAYFTGNMLYSTVTQTTFYTIDFLGMTVGTTPSIPIDIHNPINSFVDSGTSYLLLPTSMFNQLTATFQEKYSNVEGVSGIGVFSRYCLIAANNDQRGTALAAYIAENYPTITIYISGVAVTIPPLSYLIPVATTSSRVSYCLAIDSFDQDFIVLGDTFMRGLYILFDRENHRLGFAQGTGNLGTTIAPSTETASRGHVLKASIGMVMALAIVFCA